MHCWPIILDIPTSNWSSPANVLLVQFCQITTALRTHCTTFPHLLPQMNLARQDQDLKELGTHVERVGETATIINEELRNQNRWSTIYWTSCINSFFSLYLMETAMLTYFRWFLVLASGIFASHLPMNARAAIVTRFVQERLQSNSRDPNCWGSCHALRGWLPFINRVSHVPFMCAMYVYYLSPALLPL